MTAAKNSPDVIGKPFIVRPHGLRECMVCGELFTRTCAPAHAEVNCYSPDAREVINTSFPQESTSSPPQQ